MKTYIDRDRCIVTASAQYYDPATAACAIYGDNILELEEEVDTTIASKGILCKSFDPLLGQTLEAFYPPPGDPRLKARRGAVRPKSEGGATVTANEQSADYEEYARYEIQTQAALERCAREIYEERSRQELQGGFKTAELKLSTRDGRSVEFLALNPGDTISIIADLSDNRDFLKSLGGQSEQVRYLVDHCDYDPHLAILIARNLNDDALAEARYHVKSLTLDYGLDRCMIECKYHNVIVTNE